MKIDWWTLGLQTINVLVLLWILQHFLFRPVMAMIERRQAELRRQGDEAVQTGQQAEQERAALESERRAIAQAREQLMDKAHAEAQAASAALLDQAQRDAVARGAAAQTALTQERLEAELVMQRRAGALAADLATRLLQRIPPGRLDECFIEQACAALPKPARFELRQTSEAVAVRVVSSALLDASAQETARSRLLAVVGGGALITFEVDPALLAGVELHVGQAVIANNLAADLRGILEQLHHADAA